MAICALGMTGANAIAGYEPFHLEHYGRHGSRWLIGENDYKTPVRNLEKAERAGPYYRWADLRDYYLEKANKYE